MPLMVTVSPVAPEVGVTVILGDTVKVAVAELLLSSWAFMVWLPREVGGMVKAVVVKLPAVVAVVVAPLTMTLSQKKVIGELAAKPVPLIVIWSPT